MPSGTASFTRVHAEGPVELFRGAVAAGVERIVQVSALGVGTFDDGELQPAYLQSKRLADETLLALEVDAAVIRPSLVYGPRSQSGALFATLASLPVIALPGRGEQRVQPVHVFELAECIVALLEFTGSARGVYELGGGDVLRYRDMLEAYRRAQGLGEAIWVPLPLACMRVSAHMAEHLPQKVLSRDTVRLLERGSVVTRNAAPVLLGRRPIGLDEGLRMTEPVSRLDLRVSVSRPMESAMRISLGALWVYIALVSAALPERSGVLDLLAQCGFDGDAGRAALALSCALNLGLGLWTLLSPGVRLYAVQAMAVIGYTVTAAVNVPRLTIDHCGPLAKNIPIFMFVMVLWLAHASRPVAEPRRRPAPGEAGLTRRLAGLPTTRHVG